MSDFVTHNLNPIYDKNSLVLILGTFPSPKSRELGFYYSHPQNRFWRVVASLYHEDTPQTNQDKLEFLSRHHIALWDVLHSCEITGASDSSIQNPVPNDLTVILNHAPIAAIFTTGAKAFSLYQTYIEPKIQRSAIPLPSTSPANCRTSLETLIELYQPIKDRTEHHKTTSEENQNE